MLVALLLVLGLTFWLPALLRSPHAWFTETELRLSNSRIESMTLVADYSYILHYQHPQTHLRMCLMSAEAVDYRVDVSLDSQQLYGQLTIPLAPLLAEGEPPSESYYGYLEIVLGDAPKGHMVSNVVLFTSRAIE